MVKYKLHSKRFPCWYAVFLHKFVYSCVLRGQCSEDNCYCTSQNSAEDDEGEDEDVEEEEESEYEDDDDDEDEDEEEDEEDDQTAGTCTI